jgi:ABC-2 type transport system permease protein
MTTTAPAPTATSVPAVSSGPLYALRIGWLRGRLELKEFFRQRESVFFTLAFPLMMLLFFGSIVNYKVGDTGGSAGISFARYFVPGILASGLIGVAFQTVAIQIAIERDKGTLKRLSGTPMPPSAYFIGKIIMVLALVLLESFILLAVAKLLGKVSLPTDWHKWVTFTIVTIVGVAAGSLLGIVFSSVPRTGKAAPAVVTPIALALQFISGIYFVFTQANPTVQQIGALFPLKWIAQGYRSVFLPDAMKQLEPAHAWEPGRTILILGLWAAGGLFLALRTFRWRARKDG